MKPNGNRAENDAADAPAANDQEPPMTPQLTALAVSAAPTAKLVPIRTAQASLHQQQRERVVASLLRGAGRDKPTQRRWA